MYSFEDFEQDEVQMVINVFRGILGLCVNVHIFHSHFSCSFLVQELKKNYQKINKCKMSTHNNTDHILLRLNE